ncbi:MAG: hypothetical protein FJ100_12850 [Deltaproteobacteria bacterium]|nr:hypothetical protein [Deltaproteobacteria bacterium]
MDRTGLCVAATARAAAIVALGGCAPASPLCESGACPNGYVCDGKTGQCKPTDALVGSTPQFFGRFSLVAPAAQPPVAVGYWPERQSLVAYDGKAASFVAGPAARPTDPPMGRDVAAAAGSDGSVHLAWIRPGGDTLHLGRSSSGGWQVTAVDGSVLGAVAAPLAITVAGDAPVVAVRRASSGLPVVVERDAAGAWIVDAVPVPPGPRKDLPPPAAFGRSFSMVALSDGVALALHDATYGDLVLAVRNGGAWGTQRIAGVDVATGLDLGDAGDPSALALAPDGALVVAWRDAGRGEIRMARVAGAQVQAQTVVTSLAPGPAGTVAPQWAGTALAMALRPDGRAAVAWFNGSTWRSSLLLQRQTGTFAPTPAKTALDSGANLQLWPSLAVDQDGAVHLAWVEVGRGRALSTARLVWATVAAGAWP